MLLVGSDLLMLIGFKYRNDIINSGETAIDNIWDRREKHTSIS